MGIFRRIYRELGRRLTGSNYDLREPLSVWLPNIENGLISKQWYMILQICQVQRAGTSACQGSYS
jgi:hypothetical protein